MKQLLARFVLALTVALVSTAGMAATTHVTVAATYHAVDVRIETPKKTIFHDTVYVSEDGCTVIDNSGASHALVGDNALCALHAASTNGGFTYELVNSSFGLFLHRVGKTEGDADRFWLYYVNQRAGMVGLADYDLSSDDALLLTYGSYPSTPLQLQLSETQTTTRQEIVATVSYFDEVTNSAMPVAGAVVSAGKQTLITQSDGTARFDFDSKGSYRVRAESAGYTRTPRMTVRVYPRHAQRQTLSADIREAFVTDAWNYLTKEMNGQGFGSAALNEWTIMAMTAAGRRDATLVSFLESYDPKISNDALTTDFARHSMAIKAAGYDPRDFHGVNYVKRMKQTMQDGQFGDTAYVNDDVFAVIALIAAGESAASDEVRSAVLYSMEAINADGGVSFSVDATVSDVDTTAAWLESVSNLINYHTLGAELLQARKHAVQYLRAQQNPDGGWGYAEHSVSNSASTAWAMQGLLAALEEPKLIRTNQRNGFDFLMRLQGKDGHVEYDALGSPSNELMNTIYAIMPMSLRSLPI